MLRDVPDGELRGRRLVVELRCRNGVESLHDVALEQQRSGAERGRDGIRVRLATGGLLRCKTRRQREDQKYCVRRFHRCSLEGRRARLKMYITRSCMRDMALSASL